MFIQYRKRFWFFPAVIVLSLAVAGILSCSGPSAKTQELFFNSESYFTREAGRLSAANKPVLKTIRRNSITESAWKVVPDWKKELEPFIQCNISKPSMRNSYRVDSASDAGTERVRYAALEPGLPVRESEVVKTGNRVVRIFFSTGESNELYTTSRQLVYVPDSGYTITGSQQLIKGEQTDYYVSVVWK